MIGAALACCAMFGVGVAFGALLAVSVAHQRDRLARRADFALRACREQVRPRELLPPSDQYVVARVTVPGGTVDVVRVVVRGSAHAWQ